MLSQTDDWPTLPGVGLSLSMYFIAQTANDKHETGLVLPNEMTGCIGCRSRIPSDMEAPESIDAFRNQPSENCLKGFPPCVYAACVGVGLLG